MRRYFVPFASGVAIALSALAASGPAGAVDGVVLITQAKALAGNVTPGDAPGFPVTISAGGSYRLASVLAVPAGTDAIVVNGVEVTIDLNGFRITGGGGTKGDGILGNQRGLSVKNGTIRRMGGRGISIPAGAFAAIDGMRLEENGSTGVAALGLGARITNSTASMNQGFGILCGTGCYVAGNAVASNGGTGIGAGDGSTILGNSIFSNGAFGITASAFAITSFGNNTLVHNTSGPTSGYVFHTSPNVCDTYAC
jgi:hypothetical protein